MEFDYLDSQFKVGQSEVARLLGSVNLLRFGHTCLLGEPRQAATQRRVMVLCS